MIFLYCDRSKVGRSQYQNTVHLILEVKIMLQVSLFTGPDYLIEDEGTVSAHAFLATNGVIPEGGLVVSVDAPNLSEFDLAGISVEGGEIVAVRDGGFDLRMDEYTTLVNLPIADDGETETDETATFSLAEGEGYEVVADYSSGTFNLVDTRDDIPLGIVTEPNDIVSVVTDTEITPENPSFSAASSIYFDIGNRYLNDDGTYTYIDYDEDVDLYQVELSAEDTIAIESFEVEGNTEVGLTSGIAVFDADGNRLEFITEWELSAPDKLFMGSNRDNQFNEDGTVNEDHTDVYLEFTAPQDGIYYVGFADMFGTLPTYGQGEPYILTETGYSIETPGLSSNNRFHLGNYEIEIDLLTEDNPRQTGTPTPPVSNPDVTNPPTLSLSAIPATVSREGNLLANAVVEFVEPREFDNFRTDDFSFVTFTIEAEGEIPEEGIEFVLNSDANLLDYISVNQQGELPSTVGGQSLGAFYDEDGIPTGIRLLMEEPTMNVTLERTSSDRSNTLVQNPFDFLFDEFEGLETDGAEDVSFFLQPGEGYEIAPDAGTTEVTYYDSIEDVPDPTGGGNTVPEVGVTISESTLIETEETETTLTFTLSEPPPEEGIAVSVASADDTTIGTPLSQFDVLNAETTGGDFPISNGSSGFIFTITEQVATITLSVFNELTVDTGLPEDTFQEGILDLTFALQPQQSYTIDANASEVNVAIADNPDSQILVTLTGSTEADEDSTDLIESEGTVSVHTFSLSAAPPAEGLTVSVSADSLDDFDLNAIEVQGGTIAEVGDDGFDLTITEREATIRLPVLEDGVNEGSETATFTLQPGDTYEIVSPIAEAAFILTDTPDQVAVSPEEVEENDTLSQATALSLSSDNPTVFIGGAMSGYDSRFPARQARFSEDVDLYSVTLEAGQTLALDIDTGEPEPLDPGLASILVFPELTDIPQKADIELRLFDGSGNEVAANSDGAAPGEEFSRDPYLEFTADSAGTYYIGVSQLGNRNYDPNVAESGSGWTFPEVGVYWGEYELTASLVDGTVDPGDPTDPTDPVDPTDPIAPEFEPIFGSIDGDTIEVAGSGQLIFAGDLNDLVDASTGEGNNRIYAGSGDDTVVLGSSDRVLAGAGEDAIFATSGGNNTITGGAGADQFWIAAAEIPEAANVITDFTNGEDVIGIAGLSIGFDDLSITDLEGDALIAASGSDLAILSGVAADSLTADDFALA
ncbi:MAG: pre-peptidase C-terminal domain-containing protein [Cyanobacteria bacterium P01_G01_bin.19]